MTTKTERLEVRLTVSHKALIEKAAAATGQGIAAFAVSNLVERAGEVLARHQQTSLSERDQKQFLSLIDAEEKPAQALVKAAKERRRRG